MLIVRLDEPGLFVFETHEDLVRSVEAIDIEGTLVSAHDEAGRRMQVSWIEPNQHSGLGPIRWVTNGQYMLVPSDVLEPEVLGQLLLDAPYFDPPHYETELRELGHRLTGPCS